MHNNNNNEGPHDLQGIVKIEQAVARKISNGVSGTSNHAGFHPHVLLLQLHLTAIKQSHLYMSIIALDLTKNGTFNTRMIVILRTYAQARVLWKDGIRSCWQSGLRATSIFISLFCLYAFFLSFILLFSWAQNKKYNKSDIFL